MHNLVVELDLGDCLEELLSPLLVHSLVVEEVLRDTLEESERVVVVAFTWATVVYAVDQAHVTFLWHFYVDEIFNDLKSICLRKLLEDECCLLLVLIKHL